MFPTMPTRIPSPIRFGIFEVELSRRELWRRGTRIKLQDQPFEVLAALLEQPGAVVTREQLQARLWRDDTFVDFDRGLNKAINRIREAMTGVPAWNLESANCAKTMPSARFPRHRLRPTLYTWKSFGLPTIWSLRFSGIA